VAGRPSTPNFFKVFHENFASEGLKKISRGRGEVIQGIYLEGPPTSGLRNAPTLMIIRSLNHFLLTRTSTTSSFFENQTRTLWLSSRRNDNFSCFFKKLLLQKALEIFLGVVWSHPRYLEGPPASKCSSFSLLETKPLLLRHLRQVYSAIWWHLCAITGLW